MTRTLALFALLSSIVVGLLVPPLTTAQAQEDGVPLPSARFGAHPRLLITSDYVESTLKPRAAINASTWGPLKAYVDSTGPEEDAEWTPDTVLRALAVAWLVTGEADYAQRAREVMVPLSNELATSLASDDRLSSEQIETLAALAVGYDWLYDALTAADRDALRVLLWNAAQQFRDPAYDSAGLVWLDGQLSAFGNYDARWLWALTATGLALWGEQNGAQDLLDFCQEVMTGTMIPALDLQSGGAWAEGPVYGFIGNWARVQTALAWWTVAGENFFDDTVWWYDRLAYDLFLYHPSQTTTYNEDWGDPMHSYPSIIGDSERYHPAVYWGRAQDALLATVFEGNEHADWMAWFLRQPPDFMPDWLAVEEFLWRDPAAAGSPPTITTWYAPYLGHVFMRSNWTDEAGNLDTSATYVSFNAGDRLTYHQFYDQGNFTIFHNGEELLVRSGVYSGNGTSEHDANYYVRSIAANTLLICDLAEVFDGIRPNGERDVWLNDCGQRTMSPNSRTAINVDYLFENWETYDTGSILRLGDVDGATYMRADITGAYNGAVYTTPENRPKVERVIRELVYVRPGTVIVSDRLVLTYPSYTPQAVFHFQNQPAPSGLFFGALVRESAIYMQNLLPHSQVSLVSGFEVAGQSVDTSWGEPVENNFERDPYGYFRLEIVPADINLEHWFLTGFVAQDADQPPPTDGVLVLGDGVRGTALGPVQVMFDALPEDGRNITATAFQIAPDVQQVVVSGLQPDTTYVVQGEAGVQQSLTTGEAGMLVLSGFPAGAVRLTVA